MPADPVHYLDALCDALNGKWPDNKGIYSIVCHGHSVPAGYFSTPVVNSEEAYPACLRRALAHRYPFSVINVIVTAVGGENSISGAARFKNDVLDKRPSAVTIDYGLNDRGLPAGEVDAAWRAMVEAALAAGAKVILLTPSWDIGYFTKSPEWAELLAQAKRIRALADEYDVGLADAFAAFEKAVATDGDLNNLLSHVNHPSPAGHRLIADAIAAYFRPR